MQRQFIAGCVKKLIPERVRTTRPESRRKFTLTYSLFKENDRRTVCRKYFLNTLGIKQDVVYGAITKANDTAIVSQEERGKHKNHKSASQDSLDEIKIHIKSFPVVPSHYCRHDTSKLFLEAGLSLSSMYRLYVESQKAEGKGWVTQSKYREIFNKDFNLGFFAPKKDQCDQCLSYKANPFPSQEQQDKQKEHLLRKEKARDYKATIKAQAGTDPSTAASCFDLQKVLQCPHGEASSFYYKRKLAVYNLTFYDMVTQDVECFMWPEHVSSRGANQIASCLWHYIEK